MVTDPTSTNPAVDILVVDDTIENLKLLTGILTQAGYQVRPADGPHVALESALAHPPDLILLDIRMPEMDGFEVCHRLNQDERTRGIPVIFVSALQDVEDRVQAFEAGGVDFISKPFEELEVLARVNTHLQLRKMQLHLNGLVAERTAQLNTANQSLQESELRFRSTFEQAAVGIAHVMSDGRFLRINQRFCDIVGYSHTEMLGFTFQDITHPDDLQADLEYVEKLISGEINNYSMEKRYLQKDGKIVWVNLTVSLLRDNADGPNYFISIVEDITERKITEEQYHAFFAENVSPVFWLEMENPVSIDQTVEAQVDAIFREAYIKDISELTAQMYGVTREQLIGKKAVTLYPPEEYSDHTSPLHQYYQNFVRSGYKFDSLEIKEQLFDGSELWLLANTQGIVQDRHLMRLWGSQVDITKRVEVESKLRESEKKFRTVVEQATEGILVMQGGQRKYYNPTWLEMTGYLAEEYDSMSFMSMVDADNLGAIENRYQKLVMGQEISASPDFKIHTKSGDIKWLSARTTRIEWEGKRAEMIFIQDITERKWLEEQYRTFFTENVSPVFWVEMKKPIPVDLPVEEQVDAIFREAYVKDVSDAAAQTYGLTREELLGEKLASWAAAENLERNSALHQYYQRFVRSGYVSNVAEIQEQTADGRDVWVIMSIKGFVEDGHLVRIWGSQVDITERKRALEALRESEAKFRAIFDHAPIGIAVAGPDSLVVEANDAFQQIVGYTLEELREIKVIDLSPAEDNEREIPLIQEVIAGKRDSYALEKRFNQKDGRTIWVDMYGTLVRDENGDIWFGIGMVQDISERIQVEREVQTYQERLKALAAQLTLTEEQERRRIAGVLHDHVGQSLAFAGMQVAAAQKTSSESRRSTILGEVSETIRETIEETRSLVFELSPPLMNEIGLSAAIAEWLQKRVEKTTDLNTKLIGITHPLLLPKDVRAILFRNVRELLTNVIRHAQASMVIVSLDQSEAFTRITVQDDGIGFDPKAIGPVVTRSGGFGLFSIKERMADLGGSVDIDSAPGRGCTITLTVPQKAL